MSIDCLGIGVARADITAPIGLRSQGFAGHGPLARHHDPLLATAMVVADDDRKAALITCDLIGPAVRGYSVNVRCEQGQRQPERPSCPKCPPARWRGTTIVEEAPAESAAVTR